MTQATTNGAPEYQGGLYLSRDFGIGTFEVTSFGLMVGVGALVGLWLFMRELAFARISPFAALAWLLIRWRRQR